MGNGPQTAVQQIGNACTGTHTGTDGAAVGRQTANAAFLVDGHQVGYQQRPVQLLPAGPQVQGVADHRQGSGHALVAGTGDDDHRQLTAAHPGIAACRRPGLGLGFDILRVLLQQDGADVGTPVPPQTRLGNGGVVVDLPIQHICHPADIHRLRKFQDPRHGQKTPVGLHCHRLLDQLPVVQNRPVPLHMDNVGVGLGDPHRGGISPGSACQTDIQLEGGLHTHNVHEGVGSIVSNGGVSLRGHGGDHLQFALRIACYDAGGHGGADALLLSGVGHHHAFHILDDISGDLHQHLFRHSPQDLAHQGGAVGQGDGLGAAGGQNQLLLQNRNVSIYGNRIQHCVFLQVFMFLY